MSTHDPARPRMVCHSERSEESQYLLLLLLVLFTMTPMLKAAPPAHGVAVTVNDAAHRVDIAIDGAPFTSYLWATSQRKPILYPLIAPDGTTLTRGNPPLPGERVDHPHHAGLWFNYSNVNNIDYWNNSDAIKPQARAKYGSIDHDRIVSAKSGTTSGELTTQSTWYPAADVPSVASNRQPPVIHQTTRYVFSKLTVGGHPARAIDLTVTLRALTQVAFHDDKDGLLGLRVAHFLESPTEKGGVFLDANGVPTKVAAADTAGATGVYHTSEGISGDAVWSTRARWCELSGTTPDGKIETIAIYDHAGNPGYPTYWHARGYGLFAANPLAPHSFDPKAAPMNFTLDKGASATFRYRVLFLSATATDAEMDRAADAFNGK